MPSLTNPKHERFASGLAKGLSASEAYEQAGYNPSRSAASRLSTNVNVVRRTRELQERAADRAEWSAADRLRMLSTIAHKALSDDPRVAVSAIAEANKMQGSHAPAKHQHAGPGGGPIQTVDLSNLSDDDLARLEAILGPLAVAGGDPSGEGEAGGTG
ncbi:terminase small subunit [Aureimonas phyllosphaerae]|uniref:terminase small subunit n=1 Tax=Aureimonas phyllosphaerae TaxID=1166078 RepID=UPI003A5C29F5